MTAEDFLARLDHVKPTRRGWMSRCPAHEDRSPSLSIADRDGRILLRCFSGCAPKEIVTAMGLELKDLFADTHRSADDIRNARAERERKRAKAEREFKAEGARLDALREAENFIRRANGLADTHLWSDQKRHEVLDRLASAYSLLE